jgi:hypothetical protein
MLLAAESRREVVSALLGTLEGKDAQLVLSYIVWPAEAPDPRTVDAWVRRKQGPGGCPNAAMSTPARAPAPTQSTGDSAEELAIAVLSKVVVT